MLKYSCIYELCQQFIRKYMKRQHRPHPLAGALDIEDVDIEEADLQEDLLFVPYEANGGIKSHFGRHSFNLSILILSDMPQTKKGSWFLHYREKMDAELIEPSRERFTRYGTSGSAYGRCGPSGNRYGLPARTPAPPRSSAQSDALRGGLLPRVFLNRELAVPRRELHLADDREAGRGLTEPTETLRRSHFRPQYFAGV